MDSNTGFVTPPVGFSPAALEEVQRLLRENEHEGQPYLRIGVKGGGCSGLSYILAFDEKMEGDEEFLIDGISCVIQPAHGIYLHGMEIDWKNGLEARGFLFTNPNASSTCGCGTSFAV